jgi:hypothetical protein
VQSRTVLIVAAVALGYGAIRCVGAYSTQISNRSYHTLSTLAGDVRLYGDDGSAGLYEYVMANTNPSGTVLEIPYGGGIGFATRRWSRPFATMWVQLRMPQSYEALDLERIRNSPPDIVLVDNAPKFGSTYGYEGYMECPCPRLVWAPDQPSWEPGHIIPLIAEVEQKYRIATRIKSKTVLVRK